VDIFLEVSDAELSELGLERGGSQIVDAPTQKAMLDRFRDRDPRLVSGGSVANSIIAFSQFGGAAAFIGCVGDDRYGLFYKNELEELNIAFDAPVVVGAHTGTCLVLITPDAERTMRTCLAVAGHVAARHVDEGRIKDSEWLFIEGYLFANPEAGHGAIQEGIRLARQHGVKIALTCSDAWVVNNSRDLFRESLRHTDLLFSNTSEACAVTGAATAEEAFARLKTVVPSSIVTAGSHGAYVRHGGVEALVPTFPCQPKDLTGAGDMFAGAFLYGITHGVAPDKAARAGCYLAVQVISQIGARLHHGARRHWDEVMATL
jgi:sugar/nucleoside kinase (ribokinase family)